MPFSYKFSDAISIVALNTENEKSELIRKKNEFEKKYQKFLNKYQVIGDKNFKTYFIKY